MSDNCTTHRSRVPLRRSGRMLCLRIKSPRVHLIEAGPALDISEGALTLMHIYLTYPILSSPLL